MQELPLSEIGPHLGIAPQLLRKHARLDGFPSPTGKRGNARLYDLEAVQRWETEHKNPIDTSVDDSERLVTLQEAAVELGLSYGSMRTYLGRHKTFPRPDRRIGNRPYFKLAEIRAWNAQRARRVENPSDSEVTEVDGLLTRAGVAAELDVKPETVTRYVVGGIDRLRPFPAPVKKVGRTRLWDRDAIREWGANKHNAGHRS